MSLDQDFLSRIKWDLRYDNDLNQMKYHDPVTDVDIPLADPTIYELISKPMTNPFRLYLLDSVGDSVGIDYPVGTSVLDMYKSIDTFLSNQTICKIIVEMVKWKKEKYPSLYPMIESGVMPSIKQFLITMNYSTITVKTFTDKSDGYIVQFQPSE